MKEETRCDFSAYCGASRHNTIMWLCNTTNALSKHACITNNCGLLNSSNKRDYIRDEVQRKLRHTHCQWHFLGFFGYIGWLLHGLLCCRLRRLTPIFIFHINKAVILRVIHREILGKKNRTERIRKNGGCVLQKRRNARQNLVAANANDAFRV